VRIPSKEEQGRKLRSCRRAENRAKEKVQAVKNVIKGESGKSLVPVGGKAERKEKTGTNSLRKRGSGSWSLVKTGRAGKVRELCGRWGSQKRGEEKATTCQGEKERQLSKGGTKPSWPNAGETTGQEKQGWSRTRKRKSGQGGDAMRGGEKRRCPCETREVGTTRREKEKVGGENRRL